MIASRPRRRAHPLIAATMLIGGVGAVSACSAGQLAHTSEQVPAVPGVHASVGPRGELALRNVLIVDGGPDGYPQGGSAPLEVRIVNTGSQPVRLVQVSAEGVAQRVELVAGPASQPAASTGAATPTAATTPAPGPSPTGSTPASPPAVSPSATSPPAASPPAPSPSPTGRGGVLVEVPAGFYLSLVPGQGPYLRLVGLTRALMPGMAVAVTFLFDGGAPVTIVLKVPLGPPTAAVSRAAPGVPGEEPE